MKTRFLLLVVISMVLFACNKSEPTRMPVMDTVLTTKGETPIDPKELDTEHFVTFNDIQAYTHFRSLLARSNDINLTVDRIDPLGPTEDVVLCYLINYNNGWEVISADKRTPVVLAKQETGSLVLDNFREDTTLPPPFIWINYLASDVLSVRMDPDYGPDSDEAEKGIESSLHFWSAISSPSDLLGPPSCDPIRIPPGSGYGGHWELINTTTESVDYPPVILTNTTWHQDSPYNRLCPIYSDTTHVRTSHQAIAGAQMLYYLNSVNTHISSIPSQAIASGNILYYSIDFYAFSPGNWTHIENGNTEAISILIAYLESLLSTNWSNSGGVASFDSLRTRVFAPLGFSSTQAAYSEATVRSSLMNNCPVVMNAQGHFSFLGIPTYTYSHSFLIDRIKRYRVLTTYYYQWIPDEGYEIPGDPPIVTEMEYSDPAYSYTIGMNWGWNPPTYNNTWYSLYGSWTIQQYTYDDGRKMVYNFSVIN